MSLVRINLALTRAQLANLDKLAEKIGLDRTNAIRYCIARTFEAELKSKHELGHHAPKQ